VRIIAVDSVVVQTLVVLAQFDHWNDVGKFVHDAVSVNVVLTAGELELGDTVQNGVGLDGGGGADEPPLCQVTATPDLALVPALLLARSA